MVKVTKNSNAVTTCVNSRKSAQTLAQCCARNCALALRLATAAPRLKYPQAYPQLDAQQTAQHADWIRRIYIAVNIGMSAVAPANPESSDLHTLTVARVNHVVMKIHLRPAKHLDRMTPLNVNARR
jgi:hypothetical protein